MGHNRNLADYAHHFDGTHIDLGSGNIETEGVVTYEDVTNVDAIGIVTARAGVKVPDSQKIFLGTGDDLQIYHNGSHSYIVDEGVGHLYIQTNGDRVNINGGSDSLAKFNKDGNVELYYDNSKKFETTTTGATVTGTLVSDSVTSELDLSAISSSISDTATDIFVYDTRKDSDGGAWRKRTQHTSWYNETLGTATRGTRKEFPAVAVIVAEQNFIKIYDGDDPDLPIWMVFNTIANGASQGMADRPMIQVQNIDKIVYALNGILVTGTKNEGSNYGQPVINFISEKVLRMDSQGGEGGEWMGNIAQRNEAIGYRSVDYDYVIAASKVNDIAMTVLPNAPIDDATGLPVPTIAVGTDGGASIIKDDGSVVDITITTGTNYDVEHIDFTDDNRVVILWNAGGGEITIDEIPSADISANYPINLPGSYYNDHSPASYSPCFLTEGPSLSNRIPAAIQNFRAVGTTAALSLFDENKQSEEDGMVAFISSSYNTGYQQGRIKGAFLSDTDTTNLSGGNKVTNGDSWSGAQSSQSSTAPTGWTGGNGATWKTQTGNGANGTYIRLYNENNGGAGPNSYMYQAITTVVGKKYKISLTQIHHATISVYFAVGTTAGNNNLLNRTFTSSSSNTPRYLHDTFTATGTTTYITLGIISGTHNYGVGWDDVIVTEVDEDRSLNANGLHSFGTITKSAVATGADLVSYGGFNNNNYLRQPVNSDLAFVQNDFSIMFWVYDTGVNQHCTLISRDEREFDISRLAAAYGNKLRIYTRNFNGDLRAPDSSSALPFNKWTHVCVTYTGGNTKKVYIDGVLDRTITGTDGEYEIDNSTQYGLNIGVRSTGGVKNYSANGVQLALMRISGSAPSPEQVKKMYEDEKVLFQENAKATLYGSSDAVTALGYDEDTELLHVGTSAGRSDFQGLRRINNTTTAVTTAISASDELIAEQ